MICNETGWMNCIPEEQKKECENMAIRWDGYMTEDQRYENSDYKMENLGRLRMISEHSPLIELNQYGLFLKLIVYGCYSQIRFEQWGLDMHTDRIMLLTKSTSSAEIKPVFPKSNPAWNWQTSLIDYEYVGARKIKNTPMLFLKKNDSDQRPSSDGGNRTATYLLAFDLSDLSVPQVIDIEIDHTFSDHNDSEGNTVEYLKLIPKFFDQEGKIEFEGERKIQKYSTEAISKIVGEDIQKITFTYIWDGKQFKKYR